MSEKSINILHLYPDLLNLYGDFGNISCLKKRLEWRGFDVTVKKCTVQEPEIDISSADIIYLGGGSDREQEIVCQELSKYKDELITYVENGGVLIATCGGYNMLGKSYTVNDSKVEGIGILDICTEENSKRLIGDVMLEFEGINTPIIGFENHAGIIDIGSYEPFGKVVSGYGNNLTDETEGIIYKNLFATNLHGPIFPKNPELCDYILSIALKKKYSDFDILSPLDDTLENQANEYMKNKISVK